MPTIVSLQVGQPMTYTYEGARDGKSRPWTTAFFKSPLVGSAHVGSLGVTGDQQADRENHGGLDQAVLAYSADHYAYWRAHLNLPDMHGADVLQKLRQNPATAHTRARTSREASDALTYSLMQR